MNFTEEDLTFVLVSFEDSVNVGLWADYKYVGVDRNDLELGFVVCYMLIIDALRSSISYTELQQR
ncbi:hypothetical protein NPIL_177011, partial [Nephila pilipes]